MQKNTFYMTGSEIIGFIQSLVKQVTVRRIVVKSEHRVILDLPVAVLGVGVFLAPMLAGISVMVALMKQCSVDVYDAENEHE